METQNIKREENEKWRRNFNLLNINLILMNFCVKQQQKTFVKTFKIKYLYSYFILFLLCII